MQGNYANEPMLEMYLFETNQQIEGLEKILLETEKIGGFEEGSIDEIFRAMHTIKGSSAMMMYEGIATLSHAIENLFSFFRDGKCEQIEHSKVIDLILESVDFVKAELFKIEKGNQADGDASDIVKRTEEMLSLLKKENGDVKDLNSPTNKEVERKRFYVGYASNDSTNIHHFKAKILFEDGCEMENIRAFGLLHNLKSIANVVSQIPKDIINNVDAAEYIQRNGFEIFFKTEIDYQDVKSTLMQTVFLKNLELEEIHDANEFITSAGVYDNEGPLEEAIKIPEKVKSKTNEEKAFNSTSHTGMISVNIQKLDMLLDLVGELVISGMMVMQNPDVKGAKFAAFRKAATQHGKIINELQDISMSLRMVPVSATFSKMSRIVRDVSKKLCKSIDLELTGEETEIDKNIIERISDPLMHLVRNAADHGIEDKIERIASGKQEVARIVLEAKNVGSEVWIIVRDDGKGLDKDRIYRKAFEKNLVSKALSEMSDSEVYSMIFKPGFSTKETVTEFSGRGVGLDVVMKNIQDIGGSVSVDSKKGLGSSFTIKIPLTLAIIGGMTVKVGATKYTIPTTGIRECFRPKQKDIVNDPAGNEMIMIRGVCFPIVRMHQIFAVETRVTEFSQGIFIIVESEKNKYCIFADELIGEQQVVVKALPQYIDKGIRGIAACTLLSDGSISLIVDLESLLV
jgi:two-component system, chemotaxis family, sensor kinase CheA